MPPQFAAVAEAFAGKRHVKLEHGWGAANVVLKVNRKIFAMTVRGNFVAKLPRDRVEELVGTGVGECFDARKEGRLMREWIVIAPGRADWLSLAQEAHRFVAAHS